MSASNSVILMGRLTKAPDVRYSTGENAMAIAKYTLAVDRRTKDGGADFISCIAFGKNGEFADKYFKKGTKVLVSGHIQTGSYKNKDGNTVYTTDVVIDSQEFAESKANSTASAPTSQPGTAKGFDVDGFMSMAEIDEELPFV